ncbi:hypothetical protein F5Y17DRAFT_430084 [Xylariaceae sp. FL0594]|nr:hypothetical protein F5Y17DRAFT_430084 [Xylariaceae sp. FL0594]
MPKSRPPHKKPAKKAKGPVITNVEDYLEAGDAHEEAMRKHRAGDSAKSMRFADRALDVYSIGLAKFPRDFDLAYNKARLELEKATDPSLSQALSVPVLDALRVALQSHQYANEINRDHPDTLFNMAQTLTSMAEVMAEEDGQEMEAAKLMKQALDVQAQCYEVQLKSLRAAREFDKKMSETMDYQASSLDSTQTTHAPSSQAKDVRQEEQWVTVEEPVTALSLLETITSQIETMTALCSVLGTSLATTPELSENYSAFLSWIDPFCVRLLKDTLPNLVSEYRQELGPHQFDAALPSAMLTANYLDLLFRLSNVNVEEYMRGIGEAFSELQGSPPDAAAMSYARALLAFHNAVADFTSLGKLDQSTGADPAVRWGALTEAERQLSSVGSMPNVNKRILAEAQRLRGDICLMRQTLASPPTAYEVARQWAFENGTSAEVHYQNASELYRAPIYSRSDDEEQGSKCEFRAVVARRLRQNINTAMQRSGTEGFNSFTTHSQPEELYLQEDRLKPILQAKGQQWIVEQVEDMMSEGLVIPELISAFL